MERYYQQEIETADREQVLAWQNERLVKQVRHVWAMCPTTARKWGKRGLSPRVFRAWRVCISCLFLPRAI